MAALDYPILEIDATFRDIGVATGVFEFRKSTVQEGVRTEKFLNNSFDQLLSSASGAVDDLTEAATAKRRGVYEDLGGGQHYFEIDLTSLGAEDGQWGYSEDAGQIDAATATGGDRIQKVQVFNNYLLRATPDSRTPARLKYGGYHPDGIMDRDYVPVLIENPQLTAARDQSSTFQESLVCIDVFEINIPFSSLGQPE